MLNVSKYFGVVCFHMLVYNNYNRLHRLIARNKSARNVAYGTVVVEHFTDQDWISKTVYCIRCVMFCKNGFTNWNAKIALLRASVAVTYYIKLFRTGAGKHNGILMSLLLLVAETTNVAKFIHYILWKDTAPLCQIAWDQNCDPVWLASQLI